MDTLFARRIQEQSGENIWRCYYCQKCTAGCPTAQAMSFQPAQVLKMVQLGLKDALLRDASIWRCLGCDTCGARCPNEIDVGKVLEALRCFVWKEVYPVRERIPDEALRGIEALRRLGETVEETHNITGDDNSLRLIWSQNLEKVPEGLERKRGAEVVYFVGCVSSLFPRSYRIPQTFVEILDAAGVDFTTLGGEEWCCGFPLYTAGMIEEAEALIRHNVAAVRDIGARKVVFTCPSCYLFWHEVYPRVVGEEMGFAVVHATELLNELIEKGRLEFGEFSQVVTYHDPCDLGRKSGVFDPPRSVLQAIPGLTLVEMAASRENALCCGGGGNLETFDPDLMAEVAARRIRQACDTGASILVSACPQCERTLSAAVRRDERARRARLRVMDVVEVAWQAMAR